MRDMNEQMPGYPYVKASHLRDSARSFGLSLACRLSPTSSSHDYLVIHLDPSNYQQE